MSYFTKYVCFYELDKNNILMLNTLTSALDIIDHKTFSTITRIIRKEFQINDNDDLILYLKNRGYIFSESEEKEILNYFKKINSEMSLHSACTGFKICPTMGCNLRCKYCYQSHSQHSNYELMSDSKLDTIFRYIYNYKYNLLKNDMKDAKNIRIGLFGGEPLLIKSYKKVEKIFEFAKSINSRVYITTNGLTVNRYSELLNEYKDNISMQVTFDGAKSEHDKKRIYPNGDGTFDNVCIGVDEILKIGIKLNIRININRDNIYGLQNLKQTFDEHSWKSNKLLKVYATPIRSYEKELPFNVMRDSEILDILMKKKLFGQKDSFIDALDSTVYDVTFRIFNSEQSGKKLWQVSYCEAAQGIQYCFTPEGLIFTCLRCVDKKEYSIGNFDENYVNINYEKLNIWKKRNVFDIVKCKNCKFILLCAGGCPFYSLERYGNINRAICNDIDKTLQIYVCHIKNKLLKSGI